MRVETALNSKYAPNSEYAPISEMRLITCDYGRRVEIKNYFKFTTVILFVESPGNEFLPIDLIYTVVIQLNYHALHLQRNWLWP